MRFVRFIVTTLAAFIFASCGSGGVFNLNPQPDGNIVLTNATTGATLQTTLANPFIVTGGAFSIGITEDHFSGPYTVAVTAWTAPFNISCFVSHYIDQTDKTNVVKFAADNAAPVTAPTQPSPCNPFAGLNGTTQTDEETAQINDGKGHTVSFYYKVAGVAPSGGSTVATGLAVSWSGPNPSGSACGAYVLNVGAVNASGTAVSTTSANPITLSTTGGGYMGFSAASAASAASFACPLSTGTGSPGGTPTLQLTATPAQALVYFNGFSSAPSTTITASSVGLPPVTLTVANSAPSPSSSATNLALSWSGPSPAGAACGAYILNVEALNASGAAVPTTTLNPITLSTTGGAYMGFSAASSASAGFTCPQTTGSPGGTATLNLTSSPAQVLVYFNGLSANGSGAAASTTITASSVGLSPAVDTISNAQSTTIASIKLVWNGASPTSANCGAFSLNVEAFDVNGAQIVSSSYTNPVTLSTNSASWSGFSTVFTGISPAPAPSGLVCSSATTPTPSVGTASLSVPNTATPTVVYYDGPYDVSGAPTTITASAQGVPVTSYTILF